MKTTILVIEDNPDNLDLVTEILEDEGYTIIGAGSAEEGIKKLREGEVDLVLMDVGLPDMDGLEATRIVKADKKLNRIPIIALTAYAMKGDKEKVLGAGCDGYLTKPLDEDTLLNTIEAFVEG
ncbi:MAG: response regulator [Halobacteriota archaeon]|nr:response regulator [Halobacteriota archaeon]